MSISHFQMACQKLKQLPGYECSGGKRQGEIENAEAMLGIHFSSQCTEFFRNFDYVVFDGGEIFGIKDGAKSAVLEGNLVAYALYDREQYDMPREWIPIFNFGDSSLAYIDHSSLNESNEPRVVRAYYDGKKRAFQIIEVLAHDFGEFLSLIIKLYSEVD